MDNLWDIHTVRSFATRKKSKGQKRKNKENLCKLIGSYFQEILLSEKRKVQESTDGMLLFNERK